MNTLCLIQTQQYRFSEEAATATLGDETEVEIDYKPKAANFSDDIVEREAKLFEAGEYPDKDFSITEDELDNVANHRLRSLKSSTSNRI